MITKKTNFSSEAYTSLTNIQAEMKRVADTLRNNFVLGNRFIPGKANDITCTYLAVKDLIASNRKCSDVLRAFFINMGYLPNNTKAKPNDYRGVYVFAEMNEGNPSFQYVGISMNAILRIKEHFYKGDQYTASWAFLMAKHQDQGLLSKKIKEIRKWGSDKDKSNLNNEINRAIRNIQEKYISRLYISFFPVCDDHFFLHMIEPYVVCALQSKWNSFRSH
jgi:hypothetical protein